MLGDFDHIEIDTLLVKNTEPGTVYEVGGFSSRTVNGQVVTALILHRLGGPSHRGGTRKWILADTPQARAEWSRA